ncbi:hypothetical protein BIW11_08498, partial [Tropilaelaps mercedesae]
MPYIDDDLLWCQEQGDKTMTELTNLSCLDTTITLVPSGPTPVEGTLTELSHTDLTGLATAPDAEESEELLKSLNDSHLDNIESIFADLEPQSKQLDNLTILGDLPPRRRKRRKSTDSTSHLTPTIAPLQADDTFSTVQVKVEPGDLDGLDVYIKQEPSNTTTDSGTRDISDL